MHKGQLRTFVTNLLDGTTLDEDLFVTFANIAKNQLEAERAWMILRKIDSSQTVSGADGITNTKSLPTRFLRTFRVNRPSGYQTAILLRTGDSMRYVSEIPFGTQHENKDNPDLFFIDHSGSTFAFTGTRDQSYTVYLNYIQGTVDFTSDGDDEDETWGFPSRFHPVLGFLTAAYYKSGVDYDDINARMAGANFSAGVALHDAMIQWDQELLRASRDL